MLHLLVSLAKYIIHSISFIQIYLPSPLLCAYTTTDVTAPPKPSWSAVLCCCSPPNPAMCTHLLQCSAYSVALSCTDRSCRHLRCHVARASMHNWHSASNRRSAMVMESYFRLRRSPGAMSAALRVCLSLLVLAYVSILAMCLSGGALFVFPSLLLLCMCGSISI